MSDKIIKWCTHNKLIGMVPGGPAVLVPLSFIVDEWNLKYEPKISEYELRQQLRDGGIALGFSVKEQIALAQALKRDRG